MKNMKNFSTVRNRRNVPMENIYKLGAKESNGADMSGLGCPLAAEIALLCGPLKKCF